MLKPYPEFREKLSKASKSMY